MAKGHCDYSKSINNNFIKQRQMDETKTFIIVHPTVTGWMEKIQCAKIELFEGFVHLINSDGKNVAILPSNWAVYEAQS